MAVKSEGLSINRKRYESMNTKTNYNMNMNKQERKKNTSINISEHIN